MRLRVDVDGLPTQVFPLDRTQLIVGSSKKCDIRIPLQWVSRKHFCIEKIEDSFFITDLGSTNGTFVNEEKLVPQVKTPLLAFFKISIGDTIKISLEQDDQTGLLGNPFSKIPESSGEAETRTIAMSLKTAKVDSYPHKIHPLEKNSKSNSSTSYLWSFLGLLVLLAVIFFYLSEEKENQSAVVDQALETSAVVIVAPPRPSAATIPSGDLVSRDQINSLKKDLKCTIDLEKYLCDLFAKDISGELGAVQVGTQLSLLINGDRFLSQAAELVLRKREFQKLTDKEKSEFQSNVHLVALVLFLMEFPQDFSYDKLKDLKFNIAFFGSTGNPDQTELKFAAAFMPDSLAKAKSQLGPDVLREVKKRGAYSVHFISQYFNMI